MNFDPHTLATLDFPRVRQLLAERCATRYGLERAQSIRPLSNPDLIFESLEQVEDALFGVSLHLGGVQDIREHLNKARDGKVLSGAEILEVAYTLDSAMTLRRSVAAGSRGPLLPVAEAIGQHIAFTRQALQSLDREGGVRDDASPKLRQLRRRLSPLRNEIRDKLSAIMERWGEFVQENLITQRRDRYVIPIKASFVGQVQGIVVDSSASGQTFFVEPAQIVPLGNELARVALEEEAEVRRILLELSGMVATEEGIDETLWALGELDLTAAKALLAREWNLTRPTRAKSACFKLEGARHPLIENAVPSDITLDSRTRMMLITGPNMGGKTVTLKTVGLIALMYGCGMYVPARAAELPIVSDILVDIGDEQSIAESLSTFAAHLKKLNCILEQATPDTLILIDELGSGTDPSEGAALAQSILRELLERDARGIITSHLAPLKLFAMETKGLQNASMGFDLDALAPTYQLLIGQPGRSYAISIARRLGMPERIVAGAEDILGPEGGKLERLLETLERERLEVSTQLAEITARRLEAERLQADLSMAREQIGEERNETLRVAADRAESIYLEAVENVRQLRARARDDEAARPRVLEELKALRQTVQKNRPVVRPEPVLEGLKVRALVDVPAYGSSGQVLEMRGDELVVQLGVLKINVRRRDVRLKQESKVRVMALAGGGGSSRFERELNLRGQHVEEAIETVRAFVTEASALRESPVRLVHGKGQGVLRRLIRDYLKTDKKVESFHDAEPYQGGHGVTVVHLKA